MFRDFEYVLHDTDVDPEDMVVVGVDLKGRHIDSEKFSETNRRVRERDGRYQPYRSRRPMPMAHELNHNYYYPDIE